MSFPQTRNQIIGSTGQNLSSLEHVRQILEDEVITLNPEYGEKIVTILLKVEELRKSTRKVQLDAQIAELQDQRSTLED